jgi:hypothetical protein
MLLMRTTLARLSGIGLALCVTNPLLAQGKPASSDAQACISAYEQVQSFRERGELDKARKQAIECAKSSCPELLAKECTVWLDEVVRAMPSVVLVATGPDGKELLDVRVFVDDTLLADNLGVRALPVDPGKHVFRFESADHGSTEVEVVVREGEKNKSVNASFAPKDAGPKLPPSETPPEIEPDRPVPAAFWVLGAVGIAGVINGVVFESLGLVKASELDACKPGCATDDVDEMTRNFIIGDVSIAAGAVSLAAATIVYLTRPEAEAPAKAANIDFLVTPLPGGGFVGIAGSY